MSNAMSTVSTMREFLPGTTGWTADDLDDPEIECLWEAGAYEIVEGVLTLMPPAFLDGGVALQRLIRMLGNHFDASGIKGDFATEADLIIARKRVARPDAVFLTTSDLTQQEQQQKARRGNPVLKLGRMRIAPSLIIESLSIGHEDHDRETKRAWYAQARVPNYWLLNAYTRTLECLKLVKNDYRRDAWGKEKEKISPSLFPGLVISLGDLWFSSVTGRQ